MTRYYKIFFLLWPVSHRARLAIFVSSMYGSGQRAMLNLARGVAEHGYAADLALAQAEGPYGGTG